MLSIIVPTRLQKNAVDEYLFVEALESIIVATSNKYDLEYEIILAVDEHQYNEVEEYILQNNDIPHLIVCKVLRTDRVGKQAHALNEAFKISKGQYIAILEDDDIWDAEKINIQLSFLQNYDYDFVSCNQCVSNDRGDFLYICNFPTPSGWLMKREVWETINGFNKSVKYHVDNEFLGQLNKSDFKRAHLILRGDDPLSLEVEKIKKHATVIRLNYLHHLVGRLENPNGALSRSKDTMKEICISNKEKTLFLFKFKEIPT